MEMSEHMNSSLENNFFIMGELVVGTKVVVFTNIKQSIACLLVSRERSDIVFSSKRMSTCNSQLIRLL